MKTIPLITILALTALVVAGPAIAAPIITVVARTVTQAPGENVGINFREFNGFEVGNGGQVVFGAHVDPSFNTADGIWLNNGTATVRVAKAGVQAPGLPTGVNFSSLTLNASSGPYVDDAGRVTFRGIVTTGPGGVTTDNNKGLWQGTPGSLTPIYRTGIAAPDTPAGAVFSDFFELVSNSSGQVGFRGALKSGVGGVSTTNDVGIWVNEQSAGLRMLAREGSPAPGVSGGRTFQSSLGAGDVMPFTGLQLSDHGQVVFGGRLNDDTRGIWFGDASAGVSLIALGNTQAPGTPAGALFEKTTLARGADRRFGVSPAGNLAFPALLTTGAGGVVSANQHGLWSRVAGTTLLAAREASPAPGLASGVNFSNSGANPFDGAEVNDAGNVVFKAFVAGTGITASNDSAIWTGRLITLQPVVREGQLAPGAPAGFVFGDLATVRPVLNELGQFAFIADAQNAAGTVTRRGLWAWDPGLGLMKIAIQGESLTLAPGVTRTVSTVQGNFDAAFTGARSLNDAGQLVFQATFTDDSQAILKTNVPEPAAALLLGCGGLLLMARQRPTPAC